MSSISLQTQDRFYCFILDHTVVATELWYNCKLYTRKWTMIIMIMMNDDYATSPVILKQNTVTPTCATSLALYSIVKHLKPIIVFKTIILKHF